MLLKVIEFSIVLLVTSQNEASADETRVLTGFKPRTTIEIIGGIVYEPINYKIFDIDLQEPGAEDVRDVDLHVSVKYDINKLVLNNRKNGKWGQEEIYDLAHKDFYNIQITARDNSFLININGNKFVFKYRIPKGNLGKIKYLVIGKGFHASLIDVEAGEAAICNCY